MTYTELALAGALTAIVVDLAVLRTRLLTEAQFWLAYGIVVVFQLLTNGWLAGREIVRYDAEAVLGGDEPEFLGSGRVAFAPVEDLLFGFALVLWTLGWWVWLGRRGTSQDRRARR